MQLLHEYAYMNAAVPQDTYQAIDTDDDCLSNSVDFTDSFFDAKDADQLSLNPLQSQHTPPRDNVRIESAAATMASLGVDIGGPNIHDPTRRLIDAIESLRETITDNTSVQSRSRGNRRRAGGGHGQMGGSCSRGYKQDERLKVRNEKVLVELRVVFLKIGEIDTLKELYHADAFMQAKWREPKLDGRTPEELKATDLDKYWNPLLFVDNILSETKDATWLAGQANELGEVYIMERRRIKGVFLETLELNDFPLDVQDLTITVTSERPDTEIDLVPDDVEMSGINIQTFVDQQEWRLHEHIDITKRVMTQEFSSSMKSHPCISVTCRAARRPGYFYWNVFLIMFFITGLSFATFAVSHNKPENRLQLSFTLFLTSVAFKFVINQSLPKISYLTYMDKYVLMSLAILCIVSVWHAVVTLIPSDLPTSEPHTQTVHTNTSSSTSRGVSQRTTQLSSSQNLQRRSFASNPSSTSAGSSASSSSSSRSSDSSSSSSSSSPSSSNSHSSPPSSVTSFLGSSVAAVTLQRSSRPYQNLQGSVADGMPSEFVTKIERDVFISFCVLYVLAHLIFIFWLYFDASKRRREMKKRDREYKKMRRPAHKRRNL